MRSRRSADLPSGTSVTYTVTVDVDQSATGTIEATVTATPAVGITDPTPANNSATDTDTIAVEADLSITKTDGAATVHPRARRSQYTIVVTNGGPSDGHRRAGDRHVARHARRRSDLDLLGHGGLGLRRCVGRW